MKILASHTKSYSFWMGDVAWPGLNLPGRYYSCHEGFDHWELWLIIGLLEDSSKQWVPDNEN